MNKLLETKLINTLKAEAEHLLHSEDDIKNKLDEMKDIDNMMKIINNYDELEDVLKKYFKEKAKKEKWKEEK